MEIINGGEPGTFELARGMEQAGDLKKAAGMYEKLLPQAGNKIKILERLMVIYRKLKEPIKELRAIDSAIKIQEQFYPLKKSKDKKISTISQQLNKSLGHTDKKGKSMLIPPEIGRLQLRKDRLLKSQAKLKSKK